MGRLNESYGFLLAKAEEEMELKFAEKLRPYQLDAKQYGTLLLVDEKPYSSQKEIAEIQKVDRTTMVGHVDLLESLEYVKRTKNPDDRRSYCLVMTEKGKEVLAACSGFLEETELQVLSALNKEEQRLFKQLLSKIWASLNHDEGGL